MIARATYPEAERAILGSLLMDGNIALQSCLSLRPEMFSLDSHRKIFEVAVACLQESARFDYITLKAALDRRAWLEASGGFAYLMDLESGLPHRFDPAPSVGLVIESWRKRQLQQVCSTFVELSGDPAQPSGELLTDLQLRLMDILKEDEKHDEPLVSAYSVPEINNFLHQADHPRSELVGMSYGISTLDAFTEGMRPGEVTAVGARSGVGKSSEMLQATHVNCRTGIPVHLFSLEMTRAQCLRKLWAIESGVPFYKIRKPSIADATERRAVKEAALRIAEWPLRIHDRAELDLNQIVALARLSIREHGTQLFCVDYAQNVEVEGKDERIKVSKVSRNLTKLAKDEGAHLMLLSQLRKVPPEMYNKPPHVGDLRETGQIENDAHVVMLLHRPWDEERARVAEVGEIIVPKQREGETGAVQVRFNRNSLTFEAVA